MKKAKLNFKQRAAIVEVPVYISLLHKVSNDDGFIENNQKVLDDGEDLFDEVYAYLSDYFTTIAKVVFDEPNAELSAFLNPYGDFDIVCDIEVLN